MPTSRLNDYFLSLVNTLPLGTRKYGEALRTAPNSFAHPLSSFVYSFDRGVDKFVDKSSSSVWTLNAGGNWPGKYLPIRSFRTPSPLLPKGLEARMTFLSSGTSAGPDGRSKSAFTETGLTLYKLASLKAFTDMLTLVGLDVGRVAGVSLVPTVCDWPDSSLARMVHWISEIVPVSYAAHTDPAQVQAAIDNLSLADQARPVFIFGTAFHLIELLDQGVSLPLPPGSIVVETGGTKGRTRSFTRRELYDFICQGFHVSDESIVSEYGMCELASQAYDFVAPGSRMPLSERRFRFPAWAPLKVMSEPELARGEGRGALTVWDTARLDVSGAAIQTEDFAELFADGSFQFLGRIPMAPLKGCSLKVEEVARPPGRIISKTTTASAPLLMRANIEAALPIYAERALAWLHTLKDDDRFLKRLEIELGLKSLAEEAVKDFSSSLPKTSAELGEASLAALGSRRDIPSAWLVIPPSTHSIAALQVLAVMFSLGLGVSVRLPRVQGESLDGSAFARAIDLALQKGLVQKTLPESWRLAGDRIEKTSLLIFGDDPTVTALSELVEGEVSSFSNVLAATLSYSEELTDFCSVTKLVKDNIALAQRGCRSARMNFTLGALDASTLHEIRVAFASKLSSKAPESLPEATARALETVRLRQAGAVVWSEEVRGWTVAAVKDPEDVSRFLSRLDNVFVFVQFTNASMDVEKLSWAIPGLKLVSLSDKIRADLGGISILETKDHSIELVRLGQLNAPALTGLHLGRAFFAARRSI